MIGGRHMGGAPAATAANGRGGPADGGRARPRRLAAGLSVFGVPLAGALAAGAAIVAVDLFQGASEDRKVDGALALLQRLRGGVERAYSGSRNFGTRLTDPVPVPASRGTIPAKAMAGTGNAATTRHPFGGPVTVFGTPGSVARSQFRITFTGLDRGACAALADAFVGRTRGRTGIVGITFHASPVRAPVKRGDVTDKCRALPAEDGQLGFTFR